MLVQDSTLFLGNLINERPTISGCESSGNKGHSKILDGQGPFLFEAKKVFNIVLSIFIHPSTEKFAFCQDLPEKEEKLSLMTEADWKSTWQNNRRSSAKQR